MVILGQDPYHGPGQAHGLCFSVPPGVDVPPSLVNIFKEIERDLGIPRPDNGYLMPWAKQGVLLLNAVLTVEAGKAGSHQGKGWEGFTDHIVECLEPRARGPGVHALGQLRPGQGPDHRCPQALRAARAASLAAVGAPGLSSAAATSRRANRWLHGRRLAPIDWALQRAQGIPPWAAS